jgi:hypothetical protein
MKKDYSDLAQKGDILTILKDTATGYHVYNNSTNCRFDITHKDLVENADRIN